MRTKVYNKKTKRWRANGVDCGCSFCVGEFEKRIKIKTRTRMKTLKHRNRFIEIFSDV